MPASRYLCQAALTVVNKTLQPNHTNRSVQPETRRACDSNREARQCIVIVAMVMTVVVVEIVVVVVVMAPTVVLVVVIASRDY